MARAARVSTAAWFLTPAALFVVTLVMYPIGQTVWWSFHDAAGRDLVGPANYVEIFTAPRIRRALLNNAIWILVAPNLITAVGLMVAVLAQRVRRTTALRIVLFMPMAISLVCAGITFRLVYDESPDRGVLNAVVVGVHDVFKPPSLYHGARARDGQALVPSDGGLQTSRTVAGGETVLLPLLGLAPGQLPKSALPAPGAAGSTGSGIRGVVWSDFSAVGGRPGAVDAGELGLPEVEVEVLRDGAVVARTRTAPDGTFNLPQLTGQGYVVRLAAGNFTEPFAGLTWLGPSLVTPAMIGVYIWIWAGFAMVLITVGSAAIPKETIEAARVDGAGEWQILRQVTVPLMRPIVVVILLTLTVNVLKVFDLVLVVAPESAQGPASVLALEMWRSSFDNVGRGSALGVLLLVLALPGVLFNIHRLRRSER
ncbi:sugar ABC transporter permease [Dactylosporangium fulvum]|uniref:Sugar ABC transporter permease n=1 Tax=Dactylosporangium fulvum TaxID=53359 RepID=A0ABY5VRL4_9ACTN|nr:sugar ABC transporter permease [Dactylosporangium fulvum]UWP79935.1 sugar ABC transporter permease [Dactylosporangium fulvum]